MYGMPATADATFRHPGTLKGLLPEELEPIMAREGAPRYAARQVFSWLYQKRADSFDGMTDLGKELRSKLACGYRLNEAKLERVQESADGTKKLLLLCADGARIECVVIPEERRNTLCLSSQAGCSRGCVFCATALMKPARNLTAGEIVEQALLAGKMGQVTNAVFMGMGEPLDNYENVRRAAAILTSHRGFGLGHRHVTISTVGVAPGIRKMARDRVPAGLTFSLTAPDDALRSKLIPTNLLWPIREVLGACREWATALRRDFTLAYVLLDGVNDSPRHAEGLAALAREAHAKVNLIPANPARGFSRPPEDRALHFQSALRARGVLALYRKPRGTDISAACGQLALGRPRPSSRRARARGPAGRRKGKSGVDGTGHRNA